MPKRFILSEKAYAALRTKVYQRDSFKCRRCGASNVSAHHIWWRSAGGPDTSGNLASLCDTCHKMVHGLIKGRYLQILAKSGDPNEIPDADKGLKFTIHNKPQRRNKWTT